MHPDIGHSCLVSTPMKANIKLPKLEALEVDQQLYQSMLGSLMYMATGTRLDIMFTVHYYHLSQFSIAPGMEHLMAMQCVYQYLNGMWSLRITYHGSQIDEKLVGFTDSDWAGDSNSQRSVSRYAFIFCRATISWSAKKQLMIALSSTKAEYMAMTHAGKEAIFLEHIFGDVGIPLSIPTTLLIDNKSAS